uniref:Uncharacterized protein n=1 Tax=Nitzschia sp. NIES-3576 TaxID=2083273 RepID=A0A2Z5ZAI0_9STRA|nr:hypothetical protein Ycf90 [Nitzschia sp. NIES-3576]
MKIRQPIAGVLLIFYKLSLARKIIYSILITRFFLFSYKYNIKTAFYLSCITLLSCFFWYDHILYVLGYYKDNSFTKDKNEKTIYNFEDEDEHLTYLLDRSFTQNLIEKFLLTTTSDGFCYFIDPISMFISLFLYFLPEVIKVKILSLHLLVYIKLIPLFIHYLEIIYDLLIPIYNYTFLVKIGRTICPYFIRWHWTFLFLLEYLEKPYVQISRRASYFRRRVLLPNADLSKTKSIKKKLLQKSDKIIPCIRLLYIFHLLLLYWGLFASICGQYFYVPIMVDNVEYAIGFRPKNNVYTLGKTPWQDKREKDYIRPEVLESKNILIHTRSVIESFYDYFVFLYRGSMIEYLIEIILSIVNFLKNLLTSVLKIIYIFIKHKFLL